MTALLWCDKMYKNISKKLLHLTIEFFIFFSLGDRECRTQNSLLRCVQQNTESIERYYHEQGIDTTFQLNPGNHFKDVVQRTATGLQWLLSREYAP